MIIGDAVAACPDPYDDVADDCYVSSELICQTYGETIECDLNRVAPESGGGGGVGVAVYNDPLSPVCDVAAQYCIFGYDTNAIEFCCEIVASDEEELILKGTPDFNDFLYFNYEWDNTSYNLDNWDSINVALFTGKAYGLGGEDYIEGSHVEDADYLDRLHGDANDDIAIWGFEGDDLLTGDDGDDVVYGGEGNDTIRGGPGEDELFGGEDDDMIAGGLGVDDIEGNSGSDVLCGDNDNDTMTGDDGNDVLWGGAGSGDVGDAGAPYGSPGDSCDSTTLETRSNCDATFSFSRPSTCPTP